MNENPGEIHSSYEQVHAKQQSKNNYLLHIGLFIITFITTSIAGAFWIDGSTEFLVGVPYAVCILFFISCHEFGHFFAARYHRVNATLPYYIPFPSIPWLLNFGTMGAVIKTKSPVYSKKAMFDIGVAGPLAGFVACLILLIIGFTNMPGKEYILSIHPDYYSPEYGKNGYNLVFGNTIIFSFFKMIFVHPGQFFPPMSEIYHYPFLCAGWFGLFVTSMNMIPVGQLDGGHIAYTLLGGSKAYKIAIVCFILLLLLGIVGILEEVFTLPFQIGWQGWLVWGLILFFLIKLRHPAIPDETNLDPKRKFLGYLAFFVFVICFSPSPIIISVGM